MIHKCFELALRIQGKSGKKLVDFKRTLHTEFTEDIESLKKDVEMLANCFPFLDQDDYFKCE